MPEPITIAAGRARRRDAAAPRYMARLLVDADGADLQPTALNAAGAIVGTLDPNDAGDGRHLAFVAEGRALRAFGDPGARSNVPMAINARGDMVGFRHDGQHPHAFVCRAGGEPEALLPSARESQATAINAAGRVTLTADGHGFVWHDSVLVEIPSLPGCTVTPLAINDAGVVVGEALGPRQEAFVHEQGRTRALRPLPGPQAQAVAVAVNGRGVIVGNCMVGGYYHPCRWVNGVPEDLGLLPGGLEGCARAINDAGEIVGCSFATGGDAWATHPFLHDGTRLHDLRDLVEVPHHVQLVAGIAIGAHGEILAEAWETVGWQQYRYRYYLLEPLGPR